MELAQQMGVQSPLDPVNALVLGSEDVSPLDMASAYSTLADRGTHVEPIGILRVERPDGSVVDFTNRDRTDVLTAAQPTRSRTASARSCSAAPARAPTPASPVAGKTGTTQDNKDAWFVGYAPNGFTTAVWMGYPNRAGHADAVHGRRPRQARDRRDVPRHDLAQVHAVRARRRERRQLHGAVELPGEVLNPDLSPTTTSSTSRRRRRPRSTRRRRPSRRRTTTARPRRRTTTATTTSRGAPPPRPPARARRPGREQASNSGDGGATFRRGRTGACATTRTVDEDPCPDADAAAFPAWRERAGARSGAARTASGGGPARRRSRATRGRRRLHGPTR